MVIKKVFDGVLDDEVHSSFIKFGRGEYKNKYLIEGKKQSKKWAVKTGPEYSNFLVRKCLEKVSGPVSVKGVIVSTQKLEGEDNPFEFAKVSNFQGVRRHVVDTEVSPEQIFAMMDKYPRAFFALSFVGDDFALKVKAKAPTTGKPGKEKDSGPTADFCSLKTNDKNIIDELFFGVGEFEECKVSHQINVNDIVYPENVEALKPAEIRELAKRKGVIVRTINSDGIVKTCEAQFEA
jgi:hypothetical protein